MVSHRRPQQYRSFFLDIQLQKVAREKILAQQIQRRLRVDGKGIQILREVGLRERPQAQFGFDAIFPQLIIGDR